MDKPLFSIVVVSLNAGTSIEKTMNSILAQTFEDYEVIVKDGGSKDDTLSRIPGDERIHVFRVEDRSVYEGMNQALSYCKGRFAIFMNCGDTFFDETVLEKTARYIREKNVDTKSIVYGNYKRQGVKHYQTSEVSRMHLLLQGGLCHQSVFFGVGVFEIVGGYDESIKICADYDLMVRAQKAKIPYYYVDEYICDYEGGGLSERPDMLKQVIEDRKSVHRKNFMLLERACYYPYRLWRRIVK